MLREGKLSPLAKLTCTLKASIADAQRRNRGTIFVGKCI